MSVNVVTDSVPLFASVDLSVRTSFRLLEEVGTEELRPDARLLCDMMSPYRNSVFSNQVWNCIRSSLYSWTKGWDFVRRLNRSRSLNRRGNVLKEEIFDLYFRGPVKIIMILS